MSKSKKERFNPPLEISVQGYAPPPETCEEMINTFGTYNIQPTANSEQAFPAIAQATPKRLKQNPEQEKILRRGK